MEPVWSVEVEAAADLLVVKLAGELDLRAGIELDALEPMTGDVAVDVSGLRFMDGAGLRALMRLREAVETAGGVFFLTGSCAALDRLLRILDLESHFLRRVDSVVD